MSDWPGQAFLESGPTVTPGSLESIGPELSGVTQLLFNAATAVWFSASRGMRVPFWNLGRRPIVAQRMFWVNGAAVSGNVDAGLYDAKGRRLGSTGAVAQAGINAIQGAAFSGGSVSLPPGGPYYMAFVCDNVTAQFMRNGTSLVNLAQFGVETMVGAYPLPATWAGVAAANSYLPLFGLSQRSFL